MASAKCRRAALQVDISEGMEWHNSFAADCGATVIEEEVEVCVVDDVLAAPRCQDADIDKDLEDSEVSTQPGAELTDCETHGEEEELRMAEVDSTPSNDGSVCGGARSPAPALRRAMSAPCTSLEVARAAERVTSTHVPLRFWKLAREEVGHVEGCHDAWHAGRPAPQRWLQAVTLAERVAAATLNQGGRREATQGRGQSKDVKGNESASATCGNTSFGRLQEAFLRMCGEEVRAALVQILGPSVQLKPIPLDAEVAKCFVDAHERVPNLVPTLHGTDIKNHGSIFRRGLLLPGSRPDVSVRHGSCHGAGIYSSSLQNAALAAGFCNVPQVLVCGVVDDSVAVPPRRCGNFTITRESSSIRYVGDAIVAFDSSRIAPLFMATAPEAPVGSFGGSFASLHVCAARPFVATAPVVTSPIKVNTGLSSPCVDDEPVRQEKKKASPSRQRVVDRQVPAVVAFLSRRAAQRRR